MKVVAGKTDPYIFGGKVSKKHAPTLRTQKGFKTRNNG